MSDIKTDYKYHWGKRTNNVRLVDGVYCIGDQISTLVVKEIIENMHKKVDGNTYIMNKHMVTFSQFKIKEIIMTPHRDV